MTPSIPIELLPLLNEAFNKTQDCFGIFDPNDKLIYCNPSLAAMFGTTVRLATNQSFQALIEHCFVYNEGIIVEATNLDKWLENANKKRRSQNFRTFNCDLHDERWLQVTEQLVAGGYIFMSATDITEKMINQERREGTIG